MDDLISRRKAIDATWEEPSYTDPLNVLTEVRDRIEALPSAQSEITEEQVKEYCEKRCLVVLSADFFHHLQSAQPERKKGRWKEKMLDHFRKYEAVCSECGARYIGNYDSYDEPDEFNYCPNCGARMKVEK